MRARAAISTSRPNFKKHTTLYPSSSAPTAPSHELAHCPLTNRFQTPTSTIPRNLFFSSKPSNTSFAGVPGANRRCVFPTPLLTLLLHLPQTPQLPPPTRNSLPVAPRTLSSSSTSPSYTPLPSPSAGPRSSVPYVPRLACPQVSANCASAGSRC